jgi:L-ascorbate metabolism protein UlaG (beta-lactamase superfamily)
LITGKKKILFMGDSVATEEMMKAEPDVILFPVWAVKGDEAKPSEFFELAKGRLCMPMHYHTSPAAFPQFNEDPMELKALFGKNVTMKILGKNKTYQI